MNALPILFLSLVAVVTSHVLPTTLDSCEKGGPEVYCASQRLAYKCNAVAFCKEYLKKSPCEKGPEVYCKTQESALFCNKEEYCLTWPADDVVAVKIVTVRPETETQGQVYYNGAG